jgi:predicted KAP-like P-loop ATPase
VSTQGTEDEISQKGMIITDDVTYQPILDFERYSDTIVNIVRNSYPKFSIGIYGEWGTGKTTLMKVVEKKLRQTDDILPVWFNAWRYEREDQFAIVALLKTIAFAMGDSPLLQEGETYANILLLFPHV